MANFFTSRLFFISLVCVAVAATLPLYVSGYILGLLTVAFYFGVFAMAWDLLFGFAGEVNFGPTFLIGTGAYTAGILTNQYGWSVYVCILLGALGFNIVKHKLAAFIVSAFFSGLSGALLVFYFGTASVGTVVDVAVGVNVIVSAVLGGRRTVLGAALGAIFLIVAGEFLRPTGELATFIVSAVALLVVLFFPGGFLGAALSREARS